MKNTDCCLVLSGYVNGYSIIRELSKQGIRNIVVFDTQKSLAAYSNKIQKFVRIDPSVQSLYQAIHDLHQEFDRIILFPTSERHLEQLHELYDKIESYCFLPFNRQNLLASISKINQYEHCEKSGVPYPQSVTIRHEHQLDQLLRLPFPIIVKPSHRDNERNDVFRHLVLNTPDDYESCKDVIQGYLAKGVTFLASEIIPGDSSNIYAYVGYRSKQGVILNEWTGKKLSQYPNHFGVFASASNQAPPEVLHQGRKLLEAMDLYGICEPEFKYDSRDGTYKLMEINLRPMMWNRVGSLSGVNLMYTQYLDARGEKTVKEQQDQTRDLHFVYGKYELLSFLKGTISFKTLWKNLFCSDKTYFAVFDVQDIKPFWADILHSLRILFRKF
jgi:D-aspartate ligase